MSRGRLLLAGLAVGAALLLFLPFAWSTLAPIEGLVFLPVALAVVAACAGFGATALRLVGARAGLAAEDAWASIPLGAGVLGHLQLALAHASFFGRASSALLLLLGVTLLVVELRRADALKPALVPVGAGWAFACAPFVVGTLLLCALPPLFYDALTYHTGLLHQMVARGAAVTELHNTFTAMPLAAELSAGTAFALVGASEGMALVFALWLVVLLVGLAATARALFGASAAGPAAFALAAAPIAMFLAAAAKPDLLVALLLLVALRAGASLLDDEAAGAERQEARQAERQAAWRRVALALGLAAATKLTALPLVVVFGVSLCLLAAGRRALRADARALGVPALLLMAAAAPPYLRNALAFGNPFFPFASSLFGGPAWLEHTSELLSADAQRADSLGRGAALLARAFTATDGTTNEVLGGVLLLALLFPLVATTTPASRLVVVVGLVSVPPWLLSHAMPRYDPFLWLGAALLAGATLARLWQTRVRLPLAALLVGLALVQLSWSVRANEVLLQHPSHLLAGAEDPEKHFAEAIEIYPGLRAASAAAASTPGGCVFLATGDPRIAWLDAPAVLSEVYAQPALVAASEGSRDVDEVIERVRATGATHLLLGRSAGRLMAARGWLVPAHAWQIAERLPKVAEDAHTVLFAVPDPRPGRCGF